MDRSSFAYVRHNEFNAACKVTHHPQRKAKAKRKSPQPRSVFTPSPKPNRPRRKLSRPRPHERDFPHLGSVITPPPCRIPRSSPTGNENHISSPSSSSLLTLIRCDSNRWASKMRRSTLNHGDEGKEVGRERFGPLGWGVGWV
jgi:hypothetical protein